MTLRRQLVCGIVLFAGTTALAPVRAATRTTRTPTLARVARRLERDIRGRIGVCIERQGDGRWTHRADERFPMCSVFKAIAAAAVLARADRGELRLDQRIAFGRAEILAWSPVTEKHADGEGLTLLELCRAAVTRSDNTAGNLLLRQLGGPESFTAYVRSLGDTVTRLDRWEPELNDVKPGDPRDTTTPAAMCRLFGELLFGDRLAPVSRERWIDWLLASETGGARLRAGVPPDWRVGDKTGTGLRGATADVAAVWPPGRRPMVAAVFIRDSAAPLDKRNAAIAAVGKALPAIIGVTA